MKLFSLIAFAVIAIIQWVVPLKIVIDKEAILKQGKIFKFQTEPIDPENPFIGKYIYLSFRETSWPANEAIKNKIGDAPELYAVLGTGPDGYAKVDHLQVERPKENVDYVRVNVADVQQDSAGAYSINFDYPFTIFYMDEYKAPGAERVYRDANTGPAQKAYALVHVWKGRAAIQDVMINDSSITDVIRARYNIRKP